MAERKESMGDSRLVYSTKTAESAMNAGGQRA
jgi:hypothetical protein